MKLLSAAGMLAISAAMLATSTYAWFTMSKEVSALGMNVTAQAESGLVISNSDKLVYGASATASNSTKVSLKPGSTADFVDWYHSQSSDAATANTMSVDDPDIGYTEGVIDENYVKYQFYIRSSSPSAITASSLDVKSVSVTGATTHQELSKSLRVGVEIGNDKFIYAPVDNDTTAYKVWNGTDITTTTVTPIASTTVSKATGTTTIPANTEDGVLANVYVWYEGEDAQCITNNIQATPEDLTVSVVFTYSEPT